MPRHTIVRALLSILVAAWPLTAAAQSPASEETAIRKVLDDWEAALNHDDLKLLLAQFADDARIDSKIARSKVSKEDYGKVMAASFKAGDIIHLETRDVKVSLVDSAHATAIATVYATLKTSRPIYVHEWRLEKREGRWLIVETNNK